MVCASMISTRVSCGNSGSRPLALIWSSLATVQSSGAFSALAIDATLWRNSEWCLRKAFYAELHHSIEDMDEAVSRLAFTLSHSSTEAMTELKRVLWKGTENWDVLLNERAALSGRLAMTEFSKKAIVAIGTTQKAKK